MAEHSTDLGHSNQFQQDTRILATRIGCMERVVREAVEVELHTVNMNGEEGFSLSKAWKLILQTLKKRRKAPLSEEK
jgi:hypothetical protein